MPSLIKNNFKQFLDFYRENIKEVLFVEKILKNGKYIGVIDAIIKNHSDEIILIDWKYTDKLDQIPYGFDEYFGYGISGYQRYSFQLNIYYHLCLFNNIKVDSMKLVQFTTNADYHIYSVELDENHLEHFNGIINRYKVPNILEIPISFGIYEGRHINQVPIEYVKELACYEIQARKVYDNFDGDFKMWLFKNNIELIMISRMYLDRIKVCLSCLKKNVLNEEYCLCIECYKKTTSYGNSSYRPIYYGKHYKKPYHGNSSYHQKTYKKSY